MKKIITLISILILLLSQLFSAEPLQDVNLKAALHAMHNLNYDKSQQILNNMIADGNNPYVPAALILNEWYRMLGLYGNKFNKTILLNKCDSIIDNYAAQLKKTPEDFDLNFCMALAVGFKSRIVISEKNSFFVMFNGIKALKYLRKCHTLAPDNPDLELCRGILEYYIAEYPGIVKYFADKLLENTGNKKIARHRMHLAANSQGFLKYDANYMIAFIYLYIENRPQKALPYIDLLVTEFPENPTYPFLQSFAHLQLGRDLSAQQALQNYKNAINNDNPFYLEEFQNRQHFLTGMAALKKDNIEKATHYFSKFAEDYALELEHLLAITYLEQGKIALEKGESKTASQYFKKVLAIDNQTYPMAEAEKLLENSF